MDPGKKTLVYYTVGCNPRYSALLEMSLHSLNATNDRKDLHIGILCDHDYAKHLKCFEHLYDELFITQPNLNVQTSSMRKLDIFQFIKSEDSFCRVLYLDCDILVLNSLKDTIFKTMDEYPHDVLFCCPDKVDDYTSFNNNHYFGFHDYTAEQMESFKERGMKPINAGQFAFFPTKQMRQHFQNILEMIAQKKGNIPLGWEQPFVNKYFATNFLTYTDAFSPYTEIQNAGAEISVSDKRLTLLHLANQTVHFQHKLKQMKQYYYLHMTYHFCKTIDTRLLMHTVLKSPHADGKWKHICEIGVFRGEFAEYLCRHFSPDKLTAVDPFVTGETIMSGNQDGNDVVSFEGQELYDQCLSRLRERMDTGQVALVRDFSYVLDSLLPENALDMMYIDGDHSYLGAKHDLKLARSKVRKGGWICGHDFSMNMKKAKTNYSFGVRQAAEEFCVEHGLHISWICMDGCTSFCILNEKNDIQKRHSVL
jgi:lipopolysaccharide biosynthesis glycosyltransferase